jgi:hypothetical protein
MRVLSRIQGILKFQAADVLPGAISERWGGFFGHNQTGHQCIIMRQYVWNEG